MRQHWHRCGCVSEKWFWEGEKKRVIELLLRKAGWVFSPTKHFKISKIREKESARVCVCVASFSATSELRGEKKLLQKVRNEKHSAAGSRQSYGFFAGLLYFDSFGGRICNTRLRLVKGGKDLKGRSAIFLTVRSKVIKRNWYAELSRCYYFWGQRVSQTLPSADTDNPTSKWEEFCFGFHAALAVAAFSKLEKKALVKGRSTCKPF